MRRFFSCLQRNGVRTRLENNCHIKWNSQFRARWFDDPGTWVRVPHCQSTCGPTADMALRKHLREAERKGLGEESARIGHRGAQYLRFRHACSFLRSFPAPHTPDPAGRCDLTTARHPPRAAQPHYDIPQMTE